MRLDVVGDPNIGADYNRVGAHVNRIDRRDGVGGVVNPDLAGVGDGNRAVKRNAV